MSDTETCHVVVLGFDPQLEPPPVRLQRVFGLDAATCEALLENLPATVQRSVPRVRAEYFRRALLSIGAQVEVRSPSGELIEPPPAPLSVAPVPFASVPAPAPALPEPKPEAHASGHALHSAATEPLPQLLQAPSPWAAEPSPWAAAPSPWAAEPSPWAVDPTSQTMAQQAPPTAAQAPESAAAAPATPVWGASAPWSAPPPAVRSAAEPTAFVGPPAGMPQPQPGFPQASANAPQPAPAAWPAAPVLIEQPELRSPAAPTLREGAVPVAAQVSFGASPTTRAVPAPGYPAAAQPAPAYAAPPFAAAPFAAPTAAVPFAAAPFAPAPFAASPAPGYGGAPSPFAAQPARGGALDLASIAPPKSGPDPFALPAGSAPLASSGASSDGVRSRLPSDIWDVPAADVRSNAGPRDPSGIYDPPAGAPLSARTPAPAHHGSTPPPGGPLAGSSRLSGRPARLRSSAPPPPAALEQALRSSPPPPAGGAAADAFKVLQGWEQLREEFQPGASGPATPARPLSSGRPVARPAAPPIAAPPPAGAAPRAGSAASSAVRPGAPARGGADLRTFWESFGDAFALPFSGPGPYWIAAITVWSLVVGALGLLSGFMLVLGLVVSFCAQTSLLAMACDYYRVCFWAPAVGERVLDRAPDFDPARILGDYVGRGLHLSLFVLLSQVTAIAWVTMSVLDGTAFVDLMLDPITWVLFFFPYFYWPMGVALTALRNDFGGIWHVLVGLRAIARAPFEYLVIVFVGFAVLVLSAGMMFLLGSMLGLSGTILSGAIGLPLALSHGIQGALMGHLARARAEIFE